MTVVLPEINFMTTDPLELSEEIIKTYEGFESRKLAQADPLRLIFLSFASVITKQNIKINDAAKQNLLYYSRDEVLDHKGAEWDTPRLKEKAATTVLRMHLSTPLSSSKIIKKGELLATSNEGAIFFTSTKDVAIEIGAMTVEIPLQCTIAGIEGNGFAIGQINTLVKPLPYIDFVENITMTDGGAEREMNDAYRERVYLAPESLSNAGSEGAYKYFAKSASTLISDVYVYSPAPGHTDIKILLANGRLPTQEIIEAVHEKVNAREVRPLTDLVTVGAPEIIPYDLDITYYIETNAIDKTLLHQRVERAIADYETWQSSKIGRDLNPSKLISDCIRAGAKRVDVGSPEFTIVERGQVAVLQTKNVTFGGVEDD